MDVLLQVHDAKRVFPIPEGLKELASDIIREVLRHQPECIHSFIAEYLETMLVVREKARDSAVVVSDICGRGNFFQELYVTKKVTREEVEHYASVIQAAWRGYVVRTKLRIYLQKRRKIQEERERKLSMKIEEFLNSVGLTYEEATRAACVIQAAYRRSRQRKQIGIDKDVWPEGEGVPLEQRMRENEVARGRYDRWEKKDWGDFFEMDEEGEIVYDWPRFRQLVKVPRKLLRPDMDVVQFFAMRDLNGNEQYSYLKAPQRGRDPRGFPVGFLIPVCRDIMQDNSVEVGFVDSIKSLKMGSYGYVFEKTIEREDLNQFAEVLLRREAVADEATTYSMELVGEWDYDPNWVVPRILIQIRKDCLLDTDDEVVFFDKTTAPQTEEAYTFRAENCDLSLKVINHILKNTCATVEEAMADAGNIPEYRQTTTGRFIPVENFDHPKYIQKVVIVPETETGKFENSDMDELEYVFVPRNYKWRTRAPKPTNPIEIPIARFQGYHSSYLGSSGLDNMTFIMGPMLHSPDGKHLTYESIFWEEFGPESWYQLLCKIADRKIARLGEAVAEEEEEEEEEDQEDQEDEVEVLGEEKPAQGLEPEETAKPPTVESAAAVDTAEEEATVQKATESVTQMEEVAEPPQEEKPMEAPPDEKTEQEAPDPEEGEPKPEAPEPAAEEEQPARNEE